LKISPTGCSGSLLRISVIIWDPVFKASFPTAFAPEYEKVLWRRILCHYLSAAWN
jgi:hypothetical protein